MDDIFWILLAIFVIASAIFNTLRDEKEYARRNYWCATALFWGTTALLLWVILSRIIVLITSYLAKG